jgi:hypothetical protein
MILSLYLPEMLQSLELDEGYYVKNAIEKLPLDFYKDHRVQGYFENSFKEDGLLFPGGFIGEAVEN